MDYGMEYGGDSGGGFHTGEGTGGYGTGGGGYGMGGDDGTAGSSQPQQQTRRSYDEQTVIPVTISMALSARPNGMDDQSLQLPDGRNLASIVIVAAVRSFNEHSTNVVYTLEDGTGSADVKQWLNDDSCSAVVEMRQQTLQEKVFVRVIGQIQMYENRMTIIANSVRPLSSGDELAHHMLSVVYAGERYKRADSIVAPVPSMQTSGVGFGAPIQQIAGGSGGEVVFGGKSYDRSLVDQVVSYIRTESSNSDTGVDIRVMIKSMPQYQESAVRAVIDALANDGLVYSTHDENFYSYAG